LISSLALMKNLGNVGVGKKEGWDHEKGGGSLLLDDHGVER